MARGDAIFARCNVDWPSDPRCVLLPDNNARWLNHLMWLWCTKHRSPELPAHYTLDYLAKTGNLTESEVETALRAMAELDLISLSPDNCLVVHGVTNQNSRLEWKHTEIEGCENPWKTDRKYLWGKAVPVTPRNAPNRDREGDRDRDRKEHRKQPDRFGEFWKLSPKNGSELKAQEQWKKLSQKERLRALAAIVEQTKWRKDWEVSDPKHFIATWKDMERWLRHKRFNDKLEWPKKNHQRFQEETTRTDPARVAATEKQRQADLKLAEAQGMTLAEYTLAKAQNH